MRETDGRGNDTTYTVDPLTSRNEEVTDRLGHVTAYEYDANGRTAKVTRKNGTTECGNISYTYDSSDNMTAITRGDGMQYDLGYNAFGNLESIGVKGKTNPLVSYTYRNGNGRLKEVTYANGDTMKLTYNRLGQITSEKWYDSADTLTAHYKYVYDDEGNVLRSIDILLSKEYNYSYEDGRIVRSTENDVTLDSNGMVTGRTVRRWVRYYYDADGTLTKKVVHLLNGRERVYYYENSDDGDTVVKMTVGDGIVTSHSATDSFGRKVFDEIQMETGFLSRQFSYHLGEATEEHVTAEKLKSSSTTQLVSRMVLSEGTILDYEYDAEEHITKVVETSPTGMVKTTEYTYDVHGQLLTETVDGTVLNTMTYDNYGNIQSKNGVTYTYGDANWKDLLSAYGTSRIYYDAQGNPTTYLGFPLTWSKGRQLASFGGRVFYTYNANGVRVSKVADGVTHTYQVEGSKILNEQYGTTTITPIYDNEDSVCGILYNEEPLFFLKNLQGDVIAITNKQGGVLARYTYDAWGKVLSVTDANGAEITSYSHIAHKNPYRYRGYYYDIDTELYYLQSRYYDPAVGRFINADDAGWIGTNGKIVETNIFCYCKNDCVSKADESGYGGLEDLIDVLQDSVGFLAEVFVMIGNKCSKDVTKILEKVKRATGKKKKQVKTLKEIVKECNKLEKKLGRAGNVLVAIGIINAVCTAAYLEKDAWKVLGELFIECIIAAMEMAGDLLLDILARFVPSISIFVALVGGWLLDYFMNKLFSKTRVKRLKAEFAKKVKNIPATFESWVVTVIKCMAK